MFSCKCPFCNKILSGYSDYVYDDYLERHIFYCSNTPCNTDNDYQISFFENELTRESYYVGKYLVKTYFKVEVDNYVLISLKNEYKYKAKLDFYIDPVKITEEKIIMLLVLQ